MLGEKKQFSPGSKLTVAKVMKDILAQLSGEHHRHRKRGGKETNRKTKRNNIIKPSRRVGPVSPRGLLGKHRNKMTNLLTAKNFVSIKIKVNKPGLRKCSFGK